MAEIFPFQELIAKLIPDCIDADWLLDSLIATRRIMAALEAQDQTILDRLSELHEQGEIDASFTHDDWSFSFCQGRRKWSYPAAVADMEAKLKEAKKAAEGDGSATATLGASFWSIKEPRP